MAVVATTLDHTRNRTPGLHFRGAGGHAHLTYTIVIIVHAQVAATLPARITCDKDDGAKDHVAPRARVRGVAVRFFVSGIDGIGQLTVGR